MNNLKIEPKTLVWVVLGSANDKKLVKETKFTEIFDACDVAYHTSILSAHRNHDDLVIDCQEAVGAGIKVVIAMAGMAAVLPGIMDPLTGGTMPILGVPLLSPEYPNAEDALATMVRNPPGTATMISGVCASGIENSALNACKMVGLMIPRVKERLSLYRRVSADKKPPEHNVHWSELAPDPTSAG